MRILNLKAENIKKLTAIDITPTDDLILITGKNGAGKSSILDSIVYALCGGKEIPQMPIKRGADKGKITIDLGEYIITRSFTPSNTYLKIEAKDGKSISSPQKLLDKLVGSISFDPLEFMNHETKKQRDILLGLLGINVDELDKQEKDLRDKRTIIGRGRDKAESLHKSLPHYPETTLTEEVSISSLSTKLKEAMDHNASIEKEKSDNENIKILASADIERIKEINNRIEEMIKERDALSTKVSEAKSTYLSNKERLSTAIIQDTACIEQEIANAETINQQIRANLSYQSAWEKYQDDKAEYDAYTKEIEALSMKRKQLLTSSPMPVPNLSFDDTGLLYNNIPLIQASDGEKLMVSLGISMALNPQLRVLRIKDGSLLDEGNRQIIKSMIKEKDYQLWFESVGNDGEVGIIIEEGEVVKVNGKEVSKGKAKTIPEPSKPSESIPMTLPGDPYKDYSKEPTKEPEPTTPSTTPDVSFDW